ncbi:golgin subfamily A member 6-like protein 1 [Dysidea avara]|uniref:golgin subfamily A member 6-like protein 1 n=1 Tax=Dysidea avara TaxID=196820 RepID=UPI003319949B
MADYQLYSEPSLESSCTSCIHCKKVKKWYHSWNFVCNDPECRIAERKRGESQHEIQRIKEANQLEVARLDFQHKQAMLDKENEENEKARTHALEMLKEDNKSADKVKIELQHKKEMTERQYKEDEKIRAHDAKMKDMDLKMKMKESDAQLARDKMQHAKEIAQDKFVNDEKQRQHDEKKRQQEQESRKLEIKSIEKQTRLEIIQLQRVLITAKTQLLTEPGIMSQQTVQEITKTMNSLLKELKELTMK